MTPKWLKGAKARVKNLRQEFKEREAGRQTHSIYFICLTEAYDDPTPVGLYIGMTGKSPEERLGQHLSGYKAARVFKGENAKWGRALSELNALVPRMSYSDADRFEKFALEAFRGENKYKCIRGLPANKVYGS